MGFDPFAFDVKKERDVGCDREEGGDSSFIAMAWLLVVKLILL